MNSYIFFRQIRWPIILLTFGVTALLNQWDILHYGQSWPLYLIVFGVLRLAEGAALSSASAWPAAVYPVAAASPMAQPASVAAPGSDQTQPDTGIVPLAPIFPQSEPYQPSLSPSSDKES